MTNTTTQADKTVTSMELATIKRMVALRYRLLGMASMNKEWYKAVDALEAANHWHSGQFRKTGEPYISHPVAATNYLLTLTPSLLHPVETIAVMMLHDVGEDCGIGYAQLDELFGQMVADGVAAMSKVFEGVKKDTEEYARGLAKSVTASLAKPADRIHNQYTMGDAFTLQKQWDYSQETLSLIFPVIKNARRTFVRQEVAYENCKLVLDAQIARVTNPNP